MDERPPPRSSAGASNPSLPEEPARSGLAGLVREHPWITAIMVLCTLGGGVAGPLLLEETWSLARQIGAGAFLGAWIGLTITVTKMIG